MPVATFLPSPAAAALLLHRGAAYWRLNIHLRESQSEIRYNKQFSHISTDLIFTFEALLQPINIRPLCSDGRSYSLKMCFPLTFVQKSSKMSDLDERSRLSLTCMLRDARMYTSLPADMTNAWAPPLVLRFKMHAACHKYEGLISISYPRKNLWCSRLGWMKMCRQSNIIANVVCFIADSTGW